MKTPELSVGLEAGHSRVKAKLANCSRVYQSSPSPPNVSRTSPKTLKPPAPAICHPASVPMKRGFGVALGGGVSDSTIKRAVRLASAVAVSEGFAEPIVGNSAGPET